MQIKTYIVNLPASADRREYIGREMAKYPFLDVEIVEAVDGRRLTPDEIEQRFDPRRFARHYGRLPAGGEIGCTLSHRKCYEALLTSTEEVALILEDDAAFVCTEGLEKLLQACIRLLKEGGTEMLLFSQQMRYYTQPSPLCGDYAAYPVEAAYGTFAYLICRRAAARLLRPQRPFIAADDYIWMRRRGLRIGCVLPEVARECSAEQNLDSLIGSRHAPQSLVERPFLVRAWHSLLLHTVGRCKARALARAIAEGRIVNHAYI